MFMFSYKLDFFSNLYYSIEANGVKLSIYEKRNIFMHWVTYLCSFHKAAKTLSLEQARKESFKLKDFRIEDDSSDAFICLIVTWSMKAFANLTTLYAWRFFILSSYLEMKIFEGLGRVVASCDHLRLIFYFLNGIMLKNCSLSFKFIFNWVKFWSRSAEKLCM